jgi:Fe-S cluster biogenesis protein NfuA
MFIQTQDTPNPHTLKFLPGEVVMLEGTRFFQTPEDTHDCPLAHQLFHANGVRAIFFGSDFISVTKDEAATWSTLRPFVFAALADHFLSGKTLFVAQKETAPQTPHTLSDQDDPISLEICALLESRIRPAVAQDGGDILFDRFEPDTGIVYVHLQGACAGCPSSTATLKSGIENMLRHYIPEVEEVRAL